MIKCIDEKDIALVMKQYDIKSNFKDDRSVESVDEEIVDRTFDPDFPIKQMHQSILFCLFRS